MLFALTSSPSHRANRRMRACAVLSPRSGRSTFRGPIPYGPARTLRATLLATLTGVTICAAGYVAGFYIFPPANAGTSTPVHSFSNPLPYPAGFDAVPSYARASASVPMPHARPATYALRITFAGNYFIADHGLTATDCTGLRDHLPSMLHAACIFD